MHGGCKEIKRVATHFAPSCCSKILRQCISLITVFPVVVLAEFKYFRDGATLVISLDGFNWVSKRRCSDKGIKKRYHFNFYDMIDGLSVCLSLVWLYELRVCVCVLVVWKSLIICPSPELLHLLHSEVLIYPKQGRLQPSWPAAYMCVFDCVKLYSSVCVCVCVCPFTSFTSQLL